MTTQPPDTSSSSPTPWFKDGLRFKCTECGQCCTGTTGYVWITEDEIDNMAKALNISGESFKRQYVRQRDNRYALIERKMQNGDFDCIFLKDKKCMVYQARPVQCRTFPWWQENIHSKESWQEAAASCEGINDEAPLVPYSQIIQLVRTNEENKAKQ